MHPEAKCYHQQYLKKNPYGYCTDHWTGVSCPIGVSIIYGTGVKEPVALEQDQQECESRRIAPARDERAGRRPKAAQALPGRPQLGEVVADLIDERDEVTGAFAVRKPDITSEVDSLHAQPV